jgi:hypothetical protein
MEPYGNLLYNLKEDEWKLLSGVANKFFECRRNNILFSLEHLAGQTTVPRSKRRPRWLTPASIRMVIPPAQSTEIGILSAI